MTLLVLLAVAWCYRNNCILFYGDSQAHLDTTRSIIDSRTPGYENIGTVWLPLLHLLCLPFVANDSLWSTGLAGSLPVAVCFVIAGSCLYLVAKRAYADRAAAIVTLSCIALNPNVLYLSAIPMTEMVFAASLFVFVLSLLMFRSSPGRRTLLIAVAASWAMSFTRYEGWFLIPFEALWFGWCAGPKRRLTTLLLFGTLACVAPVYWAWHNWWETGNVLDFYNGPYSAKAIQGGKPYPGFHDWPQAVHYYLEAGRLCAGLPLLLVGLAGFGCAVRKKVALVPMFLLLIPLFYIWSIHSSSTPIHVPTLWPFSYYNTRYALALVLLAGFAAGAIVITLPARARRYAYLIPLLTLIPWVAKASPENWICWKESQVNSTARRYYRDQAARLLAAGYRLGDGVLLQCCGDMTGILAQNHIPLKDALHEGNGPWWEAASLRPDLFHPALWAIAREGDSVSKATARSGSPYRMLLKLHVSGEAALNVYHLQLPQKKAATNNAQ